MTISTVMACLRPGRSNAGLLQVTADLAERFRAAAIGVAARQPEQYMDISGLVPEELIEQEAEALRRESVKLEAEFRAALAGRATDLLWRSQVALGPLSNFIAGEARNADLVVAEFDSGGPQSDPATYIDLGDLLMRVGRPVLVTPPSAGRLDLERVVIGWKETPEARRAIYDALPLLNVAREVMVVAIVGDNHLDEARSRLDDVVAWLGRHGVAAESEAIVAQGDDARRLTMVAHELGAGLVVAGAFGHSRLREWVFGGVTRDMLLSSDRFTLLSH